MQSSILFYRICFEFCGNLDVAGDSSGFADPFVQIERVLVATWARSLYPRESLAAGRSLYSVTFGSLECSLRLASRENSSFRCLHYGLILHFGN